MLAPHLDLAAAGRGDPRGRRGTPRRGGRRADRGPPEAAFHRLAAQAPHGGRARPRLRRPGPAVPRPGALGSPRRGRRRGRRLGPAPHDVLLRILGPAQTELGRRWEHDYVSIAQEHDTTALTQRVMSLLRGRRKGVTKHGRTVYAGVVGDERHSVGLDMVVDLLEGSRLGGLPRPGRRRPRRRRRTDLPGSGPTSSRCRSPCSSTSSSCARWSRPSRPTSAPATSRSWSAGALPPQPGAGPDGRRRRLGRRRQGGAGGVPALLPAHTRSGTSTT